MRDPQELHSIITQMMIRAQREIQDHEAKVNIRRIKVEIAQAKYEKARRQVSSGHMRLADLHSYRDSLNAIACKVTGTERDDKLRELERTLMADYKTAYGK